MELETSRVCNLACIYCYSEAGRHQHNELTLSEILDVIDQAVGCGVRRMIVIGGGEPLLHPHIREIIEYLHAKSLAIDLFTNGMFITADLARWLYDLGVEPVVKLNSLRAEVQDTLAGRRGTLDQIRRGLDRLQEAGYPTAQRPMGVESIICAHNFLEIPEMWCWARDRGIIPYFEMITFQGRARQRRDLNVSVGQLQRLFERLAAIDREHYGCEWTPQPPIAALSCSRLEYSCTVTSTGYVQPCTGVDIKVGNVRHDRLENIVAHSPVMQAMRQVRQGIHGACSACALASQCYGCRGMAYHLLGDMLASDPLCWRNPDHLRMADNPMAEGTWTQESVPLTSTA
jgi:radical SAM protein with 4Fe4S-binding SPASM domain